MQKDRPWIFFQYSLSCEAVVRKISVHNKLCPQYQVSFGLDQIRLLELVVTSIKMRIFIDILCQDIAVQPSYFFQGSCLVLFFSLLPMSIALTIYFIYKRYSTSWFITKRYMGNWYRTILYTVPSGP